MFRQLLEDASKGLFDVVVVHTLDRWSRNLKVTIETVSQLASHNVGLVSITENIDWSNPQGRLFTQMLGAFAEYYSGALATHVRKGISERAHQGRHLGAIPFGYESCYENGQLRCEQEHPGGLHVHLREGPAVQEAVPEVCFRHTSPVSAGHLAQQPTPEFQNQKPPQAAQC